MKKQTDCGTRSMWLPARCALVFALLLGATAAPAQVQMADVKQPHFLSPAACHVHFKNITVVPRDEKTATIKFDVTWSGAWRHDVNHDAAWVFFKVRVDDQADRQPVRLAADKVLNPTGYGQAAGGLQLDFLVPAGKDGFAGMFLRLADHGRGTVSATDVTAVWDLTPLKGITKDTKVAVKAYGLKMVYVAEGPFYLGSGGDETYAFYKYTDGQNDKLPYRVTSAGAIPTGKQEGRLWARGAVPEDGGEIPATFPNGYNAFYMMDRPIPQGAYAFFLDSLTPEDAEVHWHEGQHATEAGWAGAIRRLGEGPRYSYDFVHGRLKTTCTWWLCWADAVAFAGWTGLRPMTELEHEKALRGPRYPVPAEAAHSFWGGSYGGGRYNAHPREPQATVGNPAGRAFKGTHGNGTLTPPADWPKNDAVGVGVHGGQEAACGIDELKGPFWCTSCRMNAATVVAERNKIHGFRGARTAPDEAKWNSVRGEEESSPVLLGLPLSRE